MKPVKVNDDAVRLIMGGKFYRWDRERCQENMIYGIAGIYVLMLISFVVLFR